jgi:hypothetical protein
MNITIYKLREKNGYRLYERAITKVKGFVAWPKYFITKITKAPDEPYFKEFKRLVSAQKEFKKLTES